MNMNDKKKIIENITQLLIKLQKEEKTNHAIIEERVKDIILPLITTQEKHQKAILFILDEIKKLQ